MAKKQLFLDNSVMEHSKQQIEKAEQVVAKNVEDTDIKPEETTDKPVGENNIKDSKKETKKVRAFANEKLENIERNKLKNVRLDLDTEVKILEVKTARVKRNIKSSVDSIMFEAITEWLERHYEKETKS